MKGRKPPLVAWFLATLFALVLGWLGLSAIVEQSITTGGKFGIHHAEGASAVIVGFIFIGFALVSLGLLAEFSRFRNLIWLVLALACLLGMAIYVLRIS